MKEKTENNEKLLQYLEGNKGQYFADPSQFRAYLCDIFKISNHSLRAWFSRLANPNKYGGKYSARMKPYLRKTKSAPIHHPVMTEHGIVPIPSKELLASVLESEKTTSVIGTPCHVKILDEPSLDAIDASELEELEQLTNLDA